MSDKSNKTAIGKAMTIDRDKRLLTAMITTRSVDRDGDIVEPEGMDFTNFIKNPVVLWAHNSSQPPIAKVEKTYVSPQGVLADIVFAETAFAKDIFALYADGFLNAWSIGFTAIKGYADPRLDEDGRIQGYNFRKTEMLELSAVPLPANPDALTRSFSGMEKSTLVELRKCMTNLPEEIKGKAAGFAAAIEEECVRRKHDSNIAENAPSWNVVERSSLPIDAFAWEANGTDVEEKTTYRFPHHWVKSEDGEMFLHKDGITSAWTSAIIACRTSGDVDVAALSHLQEHRKALGITDKLYFASYGVDSLTVESVKEFDALEADESPFEAVDYKVRETAFNKSISERGTKGDVPTHVKFGETASTEIAFLIVQEKDGEVIEAKVLQVAVTLPSITAKVEAPYDADESGEDSEDEEGRNKEADVEDATSTEAKAAMEPVVPDVAAVPVVAGKSLETQALEDIRLRMEQTRLKARCLLLTN